MVRYLLLVLALVALVPFVPKWVETWVPGQTETAAPQAAASTSARTLKIPADSSGHFVTPAEVNGKDVEMLVDTGATVVALPQSVARRAGLSLRKEDFTASVATANGTVAAAPVVLKDLRLGAIRLSEVEAIVLPDASLSKSLLGMSALRKLERFDISGDTLVLVQ
ncbi:retropepsin-like aspartic protease family protein [Pannonibacter tanglangensis]|uniref:TIGR02281 family clan AA aspartic protease n=1 Tax=Pannonibacter tanglangensis TaxID=2750084 RepID=A0ABW9ZIH8_9HYPH|nr:TIGR02281 family clan AA aspartic protease [Pannonibacter sp. XCT-34]NBN64675.1 TIGR02281 family clan AA aspartic protease [Pannonibacter sp. XCT-34]